MAEGLGAYLAERGRFEWGRRDCLTWAADWVLRSTGYDPAEPWRGLYRTQIGCARILKREGGLLALSERQMARFQPTAEPRSGDVGVVEILTHRGVRPAGAICTGRRWAVLTGDAYLAGPFVPLKAWTI